MDKIYEKQQIDEETLKQTRKDLKEDSVTYILDDRYEKQIIFIHGDEDKCDRIFDNLVERAGNDLKFIPESLIKGESKTFPFHNIETAKYLAVTGVTTYDDIDKGLLKSLCSGDDQYDNISHRIVSLQGPKIIIFCDNDPSDYFVSCDDTGFLHRLNIIEDGILVQPLPSLIEEDEVRSEEYFENMEFYDLICYIQPLWTIYNFGHGESKMTPIEIQNLTTAMKEYKKMGGDMQYFISGSGAPGNCVIC